MPGSRPEGRGPAEGRADGTARSRDTGAGVLVLPERSTAARPPLVLLQDEAWFLSRRSGLPDSELVCLLQQGRTVPSCPFPRRRLPPAA